MSLEKSIATAKSLAKEALDTFEEKAMEYIEDHDVLEPAWVVVDMKECADKADSHARLAEEAYKAGDKNKAWNHVFKSLNFSVGRYDHHYLDAVHSYNRWAGRNK